MSDVIMLLLAANIVLCVGTLALILISESANAKRFGLICDIITNAERIRAVQKEIGSHKKGH